jgi:heat shock protein HslJ
MTKVRVIVMLILVAGVVGCWSGGPATPAQQKIPTGVAWHLQCVGPASSDICDPMVGNSACTIQFEENGVVTGTSACNTCTGTYSYVSTTGLQIHWTCTEMACADLDAWLAYGETVVGTNSFDVSGERLVLTCEGAGGESLRLVHTRAK